MVIEDCLGEAVSAIRTLELKARRDVSEFCVDPGLIHFQKYCALVGKVRVESSGGIARSFRDSVGISGVIANRIEDLGSGLNQQTSTFLGVAHFSRFAGQCSGRFVSQRISPISW